MASRLRILFYIDSDIVLFCSIKNIIVMLFLFCLMTKIIDAADAVIQKITAFGVSDNDGRYKNTWVRLCALLEAAI